MIINKITFTIAALTLTACLAGCGEETAVPQASQVPATNTSQAASTSAESNSSEKQAETAPPSTDAIKWDAVKDPLINDAMKAKLKLAVNAIVSKDVDQFHKAVGEDLGTAHDYLLDNSMQFTSVDAAHEEQGRVLVPVSGKMTVLGANEASEGVYTFYFEKDKQNEWKIVSID